MTDTVYEETVEKSVAGIHGGDAGVGVTMNAVTALEMIDALTEVLDRVTGMKERLERHPVLGDVTPKITIDIDAGGPVSATIVARTSWARHQTGMSP